MGIVYFCVGSMLLSLLIGLGGAIYAMLKLGFHGRVSDHAAVWAMLNILFSIIPIVNIIVGTIAARVLYNETKVLLN